MRNWINEQLEILKRKMIKLGKILLALLIVWASVRFDAFWISIPAVIAYHIYMIPTYWGCYLEKERREYKEHLARIAKEEKHYKINNKERFGYKI